MFARQLWLYEVWNNMEMYLNALPLLINHGSHLELLHRRELDILNVTKVFGEDWTFWQLRPSFMFFWHSLILSLRIIKWCNGMEDQRVPKPFPLRSQEQSISSMLHFLEQLYYEKHLRVFLRVHEVKKKNEQQIIDFIRSIIFWKGF